MSKQLYTDVQDFLAALWGPQGGWTQAVMFAVDLPVKGGTPKKKKAEIDVSSDSSVLLTPAESVKEEELTSVDGSPLKRKAAVVAAAAMATKRARAPKIKVEPLVDAVKE
jgi:N-glycosylase/DNA lyase